MRKESKVKIMKEWKFFFMVVACFIVQVLCVDLLAEHVASRVNNYVHENFVMACQSNFD